MGNETNDKAIIPVSQTPGEKGPPEDVSAHQVPIPEDDGILNQALEERLEEQKNTGGERVRPVPVGTPASVFKTELPKDQSPPVGLPVIPKSVSKPIPVKSPSKSMATGTAASQAIEPRKQDVVPTPPKKHGLELFRAKRKVRPLPKIVFKKEEPKEKVPGPEEEKTEVRPVVIGAPLAQVAAPFLDSTETMDNRVNLRRLEFFSEWSNGRAGKVENVNDLYKLGLALEEFKRHDFIWIAELYDRDPDNNRFFATDNLAFRQFRDSSFLSFLLKNNRGGLEEYLRSYVHLSHPFEELSRYMSKGGSLYMSFEQLANESQHIPIYVLKAVADLRAEVNDQLTEIARRRLIYEQNPLLTPEFANGSLKEILFQDVLAYASAHLGFVPFRDQTDRQQYQTLNDTVREFPLPRRLAALIDSVPFSENERRDRKKWLPPNLGCFKRFDMQDIKMYLLAFAPPNLRQAVLNHYRDIFAAFGMTVPEISASRIEVDYLAQRKIDPGIQTPLTEAITDYYKAADRLGTFYRVELPVELMLYAKDMYTGDHSRLYSGFVKRDRISLSGGRNSLDSLFPSLFEFFGRDRLGELKRDENGHLPIELQQVFNPSPDKKLGYQAGDMVLDVRELLESFVYEENEILARYVPLQSSKSIVMQLSHIVNPLFNVDESWVLPTVTERLIDQLVARGYWKRSSGLSGELTPVVDQPMFLTARALTELIGIRDERLKQEFADTLVKWVFIKETVFCYLPINIARRTAQGIKDKNLGLFYLLPDFMLPEQLSLGQVVLDAQLGKIVDHPEVLAQVNNLDSLHKSLREWVRQVKSIRTNFDPRNPYQGHRDMIGSLTLLFLRDPKDRDITDFVTLGEARAYGIKKGENEKPIVTAKLRALSKIMQILGRFDSLIPDTVSEEDFASEDYRRQMLDRIISIDEQLEEVFVEFEDTLEGKFKPTVSLERGLPIPLELIVPEGWVDEQERLEKLHQETEVVWESEDGSLQEIKPSPELKRAIEVLIKDAEIYI